MVTLTIGSDCLVHAVLLHRGTQQQTHDFHILALMRSVQLDWRPDPQRFHGAIENLGHSGVCWPKEKIAFERNQSKLLD